MRQVNHALRKNRRILSELMEEGRRTIRHRILLSRGFDFEVITFVKLRRSGEPCFFCYDVGYIPMGDEKYRLVSLDSRAYL